MIVVPIGIPGSDGEKEFAAELRGWVGDHPIPGVALLNPLNPKHVDALIITPGSCVVVEIKSLTGAAGGQIEVPRNSAWTIAGQKLAVYLQEPWGGGRRMPAGINPLSQVDNYSSAVGPEIRRAGFPSSFVQSLVVLVQVRGLRHRGVERISVAGGITWFLELNAAVTTLTRGCKGSPLRRYFHKLEERARARWDVEAVLELLAFLEVTGDERLTAAALHAEGFQFRSEVVRSVTAPRSPEEPLPPRAPSRPHRPSMPPRAAPQQPVYSTPLPPPRLVSPPPTWTPSAATPPPRPVPPTYYAPLKNPRRVRRPWVVALVTLFAFGVLFAGLSAVKSRFLPTASTSAPATAVRSSNTPVTFASSSGNVVCRGTSDRIRCDINSVTYNMRTVPARCRATPNWGHVFILEKSQRARLECPPTRMTTTSTKALPPIVNRTRNIGPMKCISQPSGLQCSVGDHGFKISRSSYSTW